MDMFRFVFILFKPAYVGSELSIRSGSLALFAIPGKYENYSCNFALTV